MSSHGLIGRGVEIAAVEAAVAVALDRAALLLIEGPAGIGKTALADHAAASAAGRGAALVRAAADPLEKNRPFGPLIDALGLWSALGGLTDARGTGGSSLFGIAADGRYRLIDTICARIEAMCAIGPVALVVEDLHFCDATVLLALRKLRQRLSAHPLLIVVTSRPVAYEPESQPLLDAMRQDADEVLRPKPLTPAEVEELALRVTGGGVVGQRLASSLARTEGNPFLVLGLAQGMRHEGALVRDGENVELRPEHVERVPASFGEQVARQCRLLDPDSREALHAAAVLGVASDLADVAGLLDGRPAQIVRALRECAAAGLIEEPGTTVRFGHDLVRSAVLDTALPEERAWLHERAARRIAARNGPAAAVAAHLDASGEATDDEIRRWHRAAAIEALSRSPSTSRRLFDRALQVTSEDHPERPRLLVERLGATTSAGLLDEARRQGCALLDASLPRDLELSVRWLLGGVLLVANRAADAAAIFEGAAEELTGTRQGAQCLAMAATCHLAAMDQRMHPASDRALAAADVTHDAVTTTVACMTASRVAAGRLDYAASVALIERAIAAADGDTSLESHRYQPHFMFGMNALDEGDGPGVLHQVSLGRRRSEENGAVWAEALYHAQAGLAHYLMGHLDDAMADADAGLIAAEEVGVGMAVPWCLAVRALVHLHRGNAHSGALTVTSAKAALATSTGRVGIDLVALAEVRLLADTVGLDAALAHVRGSWELLLSLDHPSMAFSIAGEALRLGILAGDTALIEQLATEVRRWQREPRLAWLRWIADVADGVLGRIDPFPALQMDRARPSLAVAGVALALAATGKGGRPDERNRLVRAAEALLLDCGAVGDLERSRAELTDVTRRGRPVRRAVRGWDSLTATERLVVAQLVEGRSNKQTADALGVGVRTVESHVTRILLKLGLRSRLAIVAAARGAKTG